MGKHARSNRLVVDYQRARHRAAEEGPGRAGAESGSGLGAMVIVLIAVLGGAVFFQEEEGAEGARPAPGPAAHRAAPMAPGPAHRAPSRAPVAWRPMPQARR